MLSKGPDLYFGHEVNRIPPHANKDDPAYFTEAMIDVEKDKLQEAMN